ncbi:hypothetical protein HOU08_gp287 [Dickeya phage vB_DsoM_JA29]|uniref:Uncharacterized protein n=1 Tax=Dickeya phage vB_DsoM_JA29 TaxID=2283031 RepID=A0A384ZXL4_9CAUD|nr:hypothetical protein HOU08_gp287 [Dickeya phage vB_DsoM_JA29]AXG67013.1 hypothetical protein JA29_287 [Dickeya phage vB_DsoM_JA29]
MFPIVSLHDVQKLAELQNNLGDKAIQRGDLNHRRVDYRVFRVELSPELNTEDVIRTYYGELNFFSRTVVTSVSRYCEDELVIAVPAIASSISPFDCAVVANGVLIGMDINYREMIEEAAKNVLDSKTLIGAIVAHHWQHQLNAPVFSGVIEGSFFKTIRANLNRISWPKAAKESK